MPRKKADIKTALFDDPRAMQCFEENIQRIALDETELGARCRLALRLRRDKAPKSQQARAVRPMLLAFIKLLYSPEEKLERDDDGNFTMPIRLSNRQPKTAKAPAKKARRKAA